MKHLSHWVLAALLLANLPALVLAQTATTDDDIPLPVETETAPNRSPQTINAMLSRLSDHEARELLLQHLHDRVPAIQDAGPQSSVTELISQSVTVVAKSQWHALLTLPRVFDGVGLGVHNFLDGRRAGQLLTSALQLTIALVFALLAESAVRLLTKKLRLRLHPVSNASLWVTVRALATRFLLDIAGLAVFAITARVLINRLVSNEADRTLAIMFVATVIVTVRLWRAVSRFLVAPDRADLRLVAMNDHWAKYFHFHAVCISVLLGALYFILPALTRLNVPLEQLQIAGWLHILIYLWIAWVVWHGRKAITRMIIGNDTSISAAALNFAHWWPAITLMLVFLNWLLTESIIATGNIQLLHGQERLTMLVIMMAPVLDTMIRGLVNHLSPAPIVEGLVAERACEQTRRSFVRMGRVLLLMLLVLLLTRMWGIDPHTLAAASVGTQGAASAIKCLMTLATGYLLWELINVWISRKLAREHIAYGIDPLAAEPGSEGGTGLSRLASVLPLLQKVLQWTVTAMTTLFTLSQAGVDTTPLLAGAGIVGFAIGFGAQTLVRDVVSGLFFLLDDAFRLGEFVEVSGTRGTVEHISIRSLQLRHHLGAIHTIPYGEIPKITNKSRDWVITKMKFTVPFDTNVNQIKKIFKKIGQDMMSDPLYTDMIMQPFKSQGVYAVDDVGIIVRGKFMAQPGMQFSLRKEIYTRVQQHFAEAGIEFARKEVHARIPGFSDDSPLDREHQAAITAAAASVSHLDPNAAPSR